MGLLRSIVNLFRAIGHAVSGRLNRATKGINTNPAVIDAKYEDILREKVQSARDLIDAVGGMVAQVEEKKARIKALQAEIAKLAQLREGAKVVGQRLLAGKTPEQIEAMKNDPEMMKCRMAFNDYTSTLAEKEKRAAELVTEIEDRNKKIEAHKVNASKLQREIEKLKEERKDAVATVISAREERELNDRLLGLSAKSHEKELSDVRDLVRETAAAAKVSGEIAGTSNAHLEAEFERAALESATNSEFDVLLGIAPKAAVNVPPPPQPLLVEVMPTVPQPVRQSVSAEMTN